MSEQHFESVIKEKDDEILSLKEQVNSLQQQLDAVLKLLKTGKSEKRKKSHKDSDIEKPPRKAPKEGSIPPVRKPISDHLEREVEHYKLEIPGAHFLGTEVSEYRKIYPERMVVRQIIRYKYKLPNGDIVIADFPPDIVLPKSGADASLIAYLLIGKFDDHLPWDRQIKILARETGESLAPSTVINWFNNVSRLMLPLFEEAVKMALEAGYLQMDESPIQVLDGEKPGSSHRGYMWVRHVPESGLVIFDYAKGRGKQIPKDLLKKLPDFLQTDGYAAYDQFGQIPNINLLACWAHVRRKFDAALKNHRKKAQIALDLIGRLYALETKAKEEQFSPEQILKMRKSDSIKILEELKSWALKEQKDALPRSLIGKAINYMLNLWDRLITFTQDPQLHPDNNLIENLIRPLALGKKNFLFAGSHAAAQNIAMYYSFFGTCKANGINPSKWLEDVLRRINNHSISKIRELLPLDENLVANPQWL
ncbi:IS66 family transposase [Persicobacter sp. CCB-QB2]|uniref:IS66 family transposase n=1 Tax=Persicobacter sp. CCB-QB2 TaxID=1561025 RepID=UPI0006A9B339|nr:IS66 family transposase [Persicobacter sp. CCB-QB2]